jgi:MerR family mercuric resistance operon transcriptional regulator
MTATITEPRAMQIGAISSRTEVHIETIRYYERIGILPKPSRSGGGHRLYTKAHEQRLTFIRRSRELGFSLDEVRALLGLAGGDNRNCAEVYSLAAQHLDEVKQKIADLRRLERALKSLAAECEHGTVPHCPIIEALSA